MTPEEAKKMLKAKLECFKNETSGINHDCNMRLCDGCSLNYEQGNMGEQKEALDMAIEALEQQPCEDMEVIRVSKGALKSRQGRFVVYDVDWLKEHFYTTEEKIYGQPKQPCEDCISREEAIKQCGFGMTNLLIADCLRRLPSVTPQPKTGRWIEIEVHNCHATLKCSVCDRVIEPTFTFGGYSYEDIKTFYPYCHCGAKMVESEVIANDE